jgi:Flp pilus assembly protein TadG
MRKQDHTMRLMDDESGQTLVLVALCLTMLMGAMALVIDVGFVRYQQRVLQTAADSAALAAGLELGNCNHTVCANMQTAAAAALKEDGLTTATITPATNQCTVSTSASLAMTINVSPCVLGASDPNHGNANMAEVVLTEPQKTFFGGVIGVGTMNLVARAEAGNAYINNQPSGGNCLWAGSIAFNSSNGNFNLTDCSVYDNGNLQTDSGDSVTATSFQYYGTWSPNNCNSSCTWNLGGTNTPPPGATTKQVADPLQNTAVPSQPTTQDANNCSISNQDCWGHNVTAGTPVSVPAGYYGGGININSGVTVNFSPGLYYFNGSVNVSSGATLECTTCTGGKGVTLYFTSGSFQPNSGSTVTLSAPATGSTSNGDVANMLIWQSSTNSSGMDMDASTTVTLNGIIYLPDATLTLNSGSGTTINSGATSTAVDVKGLIVNSGVTFDINGSQALLGGGAPTQTLSSSFALAE